MIALASLLIAPALGATPVVYDGDNAAEALATVSDSTGLPQSQLRATRLDELLSAPPQALGDAVLRRCTQAPTQANQVSAEVARAEAAWVRNDKMGAMDHLDLAVAYAGCLSELVEPGPAAVAFRLRAASAMETDRKAAIGELRTALAFQSQLGWSDTLPEGGPDLLNDARQGDRIEVKLVPLGTPTGPWIDGQTVSGNALLSPGLHLLQYSSPAGIRSAWIVVGGPAALVVPGGFRRPVLERVLDEAARPELEMLVAATVQDFFAAYLYHDGGIWLVTPDESGLVATTEITPPSGPPAEPECPPGKAGKKCRKALEKKRKKGTG